MSLAIILVFFAYAFCIMNFCNEVCRSNIISKPIKFTGADSSLIFFGTMVASFGYMAHCMSMYGLVGNL